MKNTIRFSIFAFFTLINGLFSSNLHNINKTYFVEIQIDTSIEDIPIEMVMPSNHYKIKEEEMVNFPCDTTQYSDTIIYRTDILNAEYPTGMGNMIKFISRNLIYPSNARNNDIQGKVILQLLIDECGYIKDSKVIRGIGYGCDEEAIRLSKLMPRWYPAKKAGKNVKSYFTLPVSFRLE